MSYHVIKLFSGEASNLALANSQITGVGILLEQSMLDYQGSSDSIVTILPHQTLVIAAWSIRWPVPGVANYFMLKVVHKG